MLYYIRPMFDFGKNPAYKNVNTSSQTYLK